VRKVTGGGTVILGADDESCAAPQVMDAAKSKSNIQVIARKLTDKFAGVDRTIAPTSFAESHTLENPCGLVKTASIKVAPLADRTQRIVPVAGNREAMKRTLL